MKKSLAILLAVLLAFPVVFPGIIPAYASGDITITDVSHSISAGTASYNVTLQASSDGAAPAVAVVHYEGGVLTALDVEKCALSSAVPTPVTVSVPVSVTDSTRVTGFVLSSIDSAIPLRIDQIERFGSPVNTITAAEVDGVPSGDVTVGSDAVSIALPFYDASGNAADFSAAEMTITLGHAKAQASLVDAGIQFTGDGSVKTAVVDLGYTDTLRITSEEGDAKDYELKIYKTLTEDFEAATTIMEKSGNKYQGKGDTASKILTSTPGPGFTDFTTGKDGGQGFAVWNTAKTSSTNAVQLTLTPLTTLNSDYQSIEFDMKMDYPLGDADTTLISGYSSTRDGKYWNNAFRLVGSSTTKAQYDNGSMPSLNLYTSNYAEGGAKTAINGIHQWHKIRVDYTVQSDGKIIPRLWDNGTEILTIDSGKINISNCFFGSVLPPTHNFIVMTSGRTGMVCIDNLKFTQSVCNKRTPSPVTPPAISGADSLSFTQSINNGVISIDGRSKYGNVSAMVAKAASDGSAADFEALSDGALVLLDAKATNNDGSFDFANESAGLAAGWYSFAVTGTGIAAPVVHTIYYASPEEMTEALGAINSADVAALPSKLAQYENALQIAALLDDPVYVAHSAAVAKDLVAQRQNGNFTKETLASALSLSIGVQAVANANSSTIDGALSTYGSALALDVAGFNSVKAAAMRCYAGVKGEYYKTTTPSTTNIDAFFDKVIALAKVNTAARDKIVGIITDNYSALGIDTSALTNINDKNEVGKKIVVTEQSKEYMTISALSGAYGRAVNSLGSVGGSRPSSPSTPIVSTGNTTSEIQISGEVTTEAPVFNDIQLAPWAEEYITCLAENGIISGKGNGIFDPMGNVTREEFAKMLTMAVNSDGNASVSFTDVDPNAWYAPYIANAVATGLAAGYEDGSFGIGKSISRQEAAVMIARAASLIHAEIPRGRHGFADSGSIASWADEAVGQCVALGIINGNNNNEFLPDNSITRAECAKMIYCLIRTE